MSDEENCAKIYIKYSTRKETAEKILSKLIELHFKTVFVGAVFHIEQEFGKLWGESENFNEETLTDEQKVWYEKFLSLREKIFDQGNRQKKLAIKRLKSFEIDIKDKNNG